MNKAPDIVFRHRLSPEVQIAGWNNNGNISFSVVKRYYDKETKQYKMSSSFFLRDVGALRLLCDEALSWANQVWRNIPPEERKARGGKQLLEGETVQYEDETDLL